VPGRATPAELPERKLHRLHPDDEAELAQDSAEFVELGTKQSEAGDVGGTEEVIRPGRNPLGLLGCAGRRRFALATRPEDRLRRKRAGKFGADFNRVAKGAATRVIRSAMRAPLINCWQARSVLESSADVRFHENQRKSLHAP